MKVTEALEQHRDQLVKIASDAPFIVFLCGPNLEHDKSSSRLRSKIKQQLEKEGFEVVLGEDEGLANVDLKGIGINAQDNEVEFIRTSCNAVIIIADSVGSFCELGLFSWRFVHQDGAFREGQNTDCIVLLNEKYKDHVSYLNDGPAT